MSIGGSFELLFVAILGGVIAADGPTDSDRDGYTNAEDFVNGTDPQEKADYRNLGNNNVDTIGG